LRSSEAFGSRLKVWKTKPIFWFRIAASWNDESAETSCPSRTYVPLVGASRQPMMCISVDLPEPDGPMMATICPLSTPRSMPLKACTASSPAS